MSDKKEKKLKDQFTEIINDVKDESDSFSKEEVENGKVMGALSYVIPFIPYLLEKKNKFVRFHAKQGMNLFIIFVIYSILSKILTGVIKIKKFIYYGAVEYRVTPWWVTFPLSIIGIAIFIFSVVGIIYALNGKAKELPIINKLKILK